MLTAETLVSFTTTFLGAFLALGLTYIYDKHKAKLVERDERHKVLNTIRRELAGNLERIERFFRDSPEYVRLEAGLNESKAPDVGALVVVPDVRLERAALDTAIFSGKLFLLQEDVLEILSENYRRIDIVNRSSDDLRMIARGPVNKEHAPMIQSLAAVSRSTMKNLLDSLPEATSKLQAAP